MLKKLLSIRAFYKIDDSNTIVDYSISPMGVTQDFSTAGIRNFGSMKRYLKPLLKLKLDFWIVLKLFKAVKKRRNLRV